MLCTQIMENMQRIYSRGTGDTGRHERDWRRLRVHDLSVGEPEWWGPDDYTNPHAR
jgi:hypothetical protein